MVRTEQEIIHTICDHISRDPKIQPLSFLGNCRLWTRDVLIKIQEMNKANGLNIIAEARESKVQPSLFHTFIRMSINGKDFYIFDGVGVGKFGPYLGPEDEAPYYFQDSWSDMMNFYLEVPKK